MEEPMAVRAGAPGRSWRARRRRSGGGAPAELAGLAAGRRIAAALRDGPTGARVPVAVRELRRLLVADAVALGGLRGGLTWAGEPADGADELIDRALHDDARVGGRGLVAVPVHARGELAGVLVVAGAVSGGSVREAAEWVGEALDRARLEASAQVAQQAELRALRAEISPHFVYNSLTAIASFVSSDPERAHDLMLDFAEYTRHSLARHGDYTTVSGEFQAIEAYLALARAVLGERLRVQLRIAPEVLPVALPYLVLQPLVENAVRHGVELPGGSGLVQVTGEADGTECVITVEDDGPGMDPDYATAVLAGEGVPGHLGLVNVDRRLRTVYGAGYGLVVETATGAGTRVLVRLPRFQPGVVAQ
jgi:two-component system LytT family sensor kinase